METVDLKTRRILEDYKSGLITAAEAARRLTENGQSQLPTGQTEKDSEVLTQDAVLDTSREARAGFPEAIYGASRLNL